MLSKTLVSEIKAQASFLGRGSDGLSTSGRLAHIDTCTTSSNFLIVTACPKMTHACEVD